ncbi:predicted protein [Naegleria gruberi]|uniref:Predicted protein n=1 Tax=Naegleria gruberi TaxID=5762 RepID=D2VNJ6_NAEGR|nr:uncharacterized protein NAEGRDRAFT_70524 [Naegleria gruberi]EFC41669.1 predicted protein [Naegleria gruberi]|eukprot:XP_002674413.1 predicted protein [Naegleria gruberi strain NEG-M]
MQDLSILIPPELWRTVYSFLNTPYRPHFERVNLLFRSLCLEEERREINEIFQLHNRYLLKPLCEAPVAEEKIRKIEEMIQRKIPFHLREFIKVSDGRIKTIRRREMPSVINMSPHWSNCLYSFDNWCFSGRFLTISTFHKQKTEFRIDLENGKVETCSNSCREGISVKEWLKMSFDCSRTINPFNIDKLCHESNRNDLKSILRHCGYLFEILPENLRKDRELVKSALVSSNLPFRLTSKEIADDTELVRWYFENGNTKFQYLSDKFRQDKNLILKYSKEWEDAHESLYTDTEILLHYLKTSRQRIVPELKTLSEDLIIEATKYGKEVNIDNCFSNELVLKMLEYTTPKERSLLGKNLKNHEKSLDERVLKRLFEVNPIFVCLNFENENFKLTKEQLLLDLTELGENFKNLPYQWRMDREVARAATQKQFYNYIYLDNELANDIEFLAPILENAKIPLSLPQQYFNQLLRVINKDEEILRKILTNNPSLLAHTPNLDEEFVNSLDFKYCSGRFIEILQRTSFEQYCEHYKQNYDY